MNPGMIAAIAYGVLVLLGGIVGYAKVQSKPSLISGGISGVLLILGAILSFQGIAGGQWLAIAVTALLVVVFTIRIVKTRKWMPAGLILISGIVALVVMLIAL